MLTSRSWGRSESVPVTPSPMPRARPSTRIETASDARAQVTSTSPTCQRFPFTRAALTAKLSAGRMSSKSTMGSTRLQETSLGISSASRPATIRATAAAAARNSGGRLAR